MVEDRFDGWKAPEINECELTKYNWLVQNKNNLDFTPEGSSLEVYFVIRLSNVKFPSQISILS